MLPPLLDDADTWAQTLFPMEILRQIGSPFGHTLDPTDDQAIALCRVNNREAFSIAILSSIYVAKMVIEHSAANRSQPQPIAMRGEAELAISATRGLERGRLTLGASPTVGAYLLPRALQAFASQYPGIQVQLNIARSEEVIGQVLASRIPIGFVEAVVAENAALEVQPFAHDDMVLIAPPDHPWSRAGRVTRARLRGGLILRRESGSGLRALVDHMLAQAGLAVTTAMELGSTEALVEAVRAGVGVAWVPRSAAARQADLGQLGIVEVSGLDPRRTLYVVRSKDVRLAAAPQAFLDIVREQAHAGV